MKYYPFKPLFILRLPGNANKDIIIKARESLQYLDSAGWAVVVIDGGPLGSITYDTVLPPAVDVDSRYVHKPDEMK